jgi:multidrug efflux pump subunit AcrB
VTSIINFLVTRGLVVSLVTIFIIAIGVFAIFKINREAFPNVNLDKIQINVAQPGASPEEIERLIVIPIEQELKVLHGIDTMTSVSFPGSAKILLELDPDSSNREKIANEVQQAVDRARLPTDLPDEPYVTEVDARVFPVIQLAISAPLDEVTLKRISNQIEDDLLQVEGVGRVQVVGDRKTEIGIIVDPGKLRQQRITVGEIADVLKKWNINASGGGIDTESGQKTVRIIGEFDSAEDAANLVLRANELGQGISLADVATVSARLEKAAIYQDVSGEPAVHMVVMKKSDADIIDTVDNIKSYLATIPGVYGENISIATFEDFSRFARLRLGVLTNNGMVGALLVLITLVIFLRPSVAISTTISLPIVILLGLFLLYLSGVTLNLISMMAFIMVLGMLVDDAIILGENIAFHLEQGEPRNKAAVIGATELLGPVTTTILTTIVAFAPLMFISGIIGKFIIAIPIVAILLLSLSWLESFLILPNHVAHLTKPGHQVHERTWLKWLEHKYGNFLKFTLEHHWLMVVLAVLMLAGSILLAKSDKMRFELFPPVGIEQYLVRVTNEPGTSLEEMRLTLKQVDQHIRNMINPEYLDATLITTGQMAKDGGDPTIQKGSRFGQIRAIYTPAVVRPEHDALKEMFRVRDSVQTAFPRLQFAFEEIRPGPPTGRALQVELSSRNIEQSEKVAGQLMAYLANIDGITTIESDLLPGDDELRIEFDKALAAYAGIDLATASSHIRAAVDGLRVTTTRWENEEVDITIRFPEESATSQIQQLRKLQILNNRGGMVTLERIASFTEQQGYTNIRHKEGRKIISVMANIDPAKLTSSRLNSMVEKDQQTWMGDFAGKVNATYGGENEKNQESMFDLAVAFMFALLAIFFLLAIQFNNLGYPLAVMLAIPFGVIGVIVSFYLHDLLWKPMPLSFMSTLGMVALTGVVVNSSLVLLVFIQRNIKKGMSRHEAIITAGRRRLRAVLLTAATTIMGLLPTAYGWGGLDPFVSSMALALSWGLIFATLITLIVIPALFSAGIDIKNGIKSVLFAFK